MATWWALTFTGEPTENDFARVSEMVAEGFTSGQLIENPEDPDIGTQLEIRRPGGVRETWTFRGRTPRGMLIMDRAGETGVIFSPSTFGLSLPGRAG
jgi:hypothetical protein